MFISCQVIGKPGPLKKAYECLISRDPNKFWTSGQWMTERKGGSDVGEAINISLLTVCRFLFDLDDFFVCSTIVMLSIDFGFVENCYRRTNRPYVWKWNASLCLTNGTRHIYLFSLCSKWNRNNSYSTKRWNLQIVRLQMVLICHRQRHEYYIGAYCWQQWTNSSSKRQLGQTIF